VSEEERGAGDAQEKQEPRSKDVANDISKLNPFGDRRHLYLKTLQYPVRNDELRMFETYPFQRQKVHLLEDTWTSCFSIL